MSSVNVFDRLIRGIKRADTPLGRFAKSAIRSLYNPTLPRLPKPILFLLRAVYEAQWLAIVVGRWFITMCYRNPVFQSRCASFGKNVKLEGPMPFVEGHVQIHIGNNVGLGGDIAIFSGRMNDEPRLVIGDRSNLGWGVTLAVSSEIIIEEDVWIPSDCRITDSDGHPREADLRLAMHPPHPKDIRPVRICKKAWLGAGTTVMKGVTIGEGAIIGARSVVISDIPPYSLAMGNPAEVFFKNFGLPTTARRQKKVPLAESAGGERSAEKRESETAS
jgi:acetyltransferase-like isoleucine patch superfamily enzyme